MDESTPSELPQKFWGVTDLIAFAAFFVLTLILLPVTFVAIAGIFRPGLTVATLPGEAQVLIQAVLDVVWVGFIFFLIRKIHHRGIRDSIHWFHSPQFHTGSLIALGAFLAVAVLVVSSFFPPAAETPIEKLVETSRTLYTLVIFGIFFAPILEEVMFRGFFFNVLEDLRGPRLAVPCTAALFALLHAPQLWGSWAGIGLIFVVGYVLSLARKRSNSLIPSVIIHMSYNSMLFGASLVGALAQRGK